MSYIIGFIEFEDSSTDYPVECFRTDLQPGDRVLVRIDNGKLKPGIVTRLEYLNWNCKGRIECPIAEALVGDDGVLSPPPGSPISVGLASAQPVIARLKSEGWVPLKSSQNMHRSILSNSNSTQSANILFRRNGVDFQILPKRHDVAPRAYSYLKHAVTEGRVVRHFLARTTFNLYEGVLRFSQSFMSNEGNYDRFFNPVGSRDKTTAELKNRLRLARGNDEDDPEDSLRSVLAGCEDSMGRIYLGDGIYI